MDFYLSYWKKINNSSKLFYTHGLLRNFVIDENQKNRQQPISVARQEEKSQIATLATDSTIPDEIYSKKSQWPNTFGTSLYLIALVTDITTFLYMYKVARGSMVPRYLMFNVCVT